MIDRSYLPFQSARYYQDRKMAKWMGFFLSEHSSALVDDMNKVSISTELTLEKKLMLLSQLYANQLTARFSIKGGKLPESYSGTIPSITREHLIIRTTEGHINIALEDIINIEMIEETHNESA